MYATKTGLLHSDSRKLHGNLHKRLPWPVSVSALQVKVKLRVNKQMGKRAQRKR